MRRPGSCDLPPEGRPLDLRLAVAGLLAGRLLRGRLLAAPAGLLLSSCHYWVTPLLVNSSAAIPFPESPEGANASSFPTQTAALEPLLLRTVTPRFRIRQGTTPKKTR